MDRPKQCTDEMLDFLDKAFTAKTNTVGVKLFEKFPVLQVTPTSLTPTKEVLSYWEEIRGVEYLSCLD